MKHLKTSLLLAIGMAFLNVLPLNAMENAKCQLHFQAATARNLDTIMLKTMSKESYMAPYVRYLMQADVQWEEDEMRIYTLVFIDDDDIPEMLVRTFNPAEDMVVLTQNKGEVTMQILANKEVSFIEGIGLLKNSHCNMGYCGIEVYKIKDGKIDLIAQEIEHSEIGLEEDEMGCSFNGVVMDLESALKLVEQAFDEKGDPVEMYSIEWLSLDELFEQREEIKNWK